MILAPIIPEREAELRRLLASMNDAPGRLKPDNALVPFRQFDTLHCRAAAASWTTRRSAT